MTSIGYSAFNNCSNLSTVVFAQGSQLESIGNYAFSDCSSLTEITLPASVTSIGDSAFSNCSNLATVTFAEGSQLESIDNYAFSGCSALQSIEIPTRVTSIGDRAFNNCSNLTEITLPSSVTSIGNEAFYHCTNLTEIYYQGTMDQWLNMTFGRSWHSYNDNTNLYFNDELVDEITINEDFPSYAFCGIGSITKVTLGEGVTSIGDGAFSNCSNLATIVHSLVAVLYNQ